MRAVPRAQMETAEAYGMTRRQTFWRIVVPQMWVYALPGLSNLWMVLIKATPLLFLLGVEDIVYDYSGGFTSRRAITGDWGGTRQECMRILRHEAGHAIDNAYRLGRRR